MLLPVPELCQHLGHVVEIDELPCLLVFFLMFAVGGSCTRNGYSHSSGSDTVPVTCVNNLSLITPKVSTILREGQGRSAFVMVVCKHKTRLCYERGQAVFSFFKNSSELTIELNGR